ncbi:hypothetical protein M8J75_016540 [Diaphorina citri]|nr:hypothetical protein M8J75_016540 [Diaphorina citri]
MGETIRKSERDIHAKTKLQAAGEEKNSTIQNKHEKAEEEEEKVEEEMKEEEEKSEEEKEVEEKEKIHTQ